jgi:hypothetical protein
MSAFWLAELDDELHECDLPPLRRGRAHKCECGCEWQALGLAGRLRWVLIRDPDRKP